MRQFILRLLALLLFQCTSALLAQELPIWESYTRPTQINDVLETQERVYLATNGGITVLDALSQEIVEQWTRQSHALPSNMVESIAFEPGTEMMVIGTYDLGVFRASDGENLNWEAVPFPDDLLNSGNQLLTYCLAFDNQNRLCVGTSRGLLILDQPGQWLHYGPSDFNNLVHAVWDMQLGTDGTLYVGGNITLKVKDGVVAAHTAVPPQGVQFSDSLHFAYGHREFFLMPNGNLWDLGDIGQIVRSTPSGDWSLYGFLFQPDDPHFNIFNRNFVQNGQLHVESNDHYVRFNGSGWDTIATPYQNPNLSHVFTIDDRLFGTEEDDLYALDVSQDQATGKLGNWPFASNLRKLYSDPAGYCWTTTSVGELMNINTGETLSLPAHEGNNGYQDVYFAASSSNDIWLQRSGQLLYWQDRQSLLAYPFADVQVAPQFIRNVVFTANGTPWFSDDKNRVFSLENQQWELQYDFGTNGFCYAILPIEGEAAVAFHYWADNFTVKQCSATEVVDFELPDFLNDGQLFNAYGGENQEIFLLDRMTSEVAKFTNGQWSQSSLPANLLQEGYIHYFHADNDQLTIVTRERIILFDGENWSIYDDQNSPIDTRNINAVGEGQDGRLYFLHGNFYNQALEVLIPATVSSATTPVTQPGAQLVAFPNPTSDYLTIETPWNQSTYELLDLTGRLMIKGSCRAKRTSIYIGHLPAGTYMLRLNSEGRKSMSSRIILLH